METDNEEILEINELVEELENIKTSDPDVIQLSFYNLKNNKSEAIINNSDDKTFIKGKNIFYNFSFVERLWVSHITIDTKKYSDWHRVEFKWFDNWNNVNVNITKSNDSYTIIINSFIEGFSFKPPKTWISDNKIISMNTFGFNSDDFYDSIKLITDIEKYQQNIIDKSQLLIQEADTALVSLGSTETLIEQKNDELTIVLNDLKLAKKDEDELNQSIIALKSEESDISTRIETLEDSIDGKKNERKLLTSDLENKKDELTKLNSDINMFPSEITGFVNEGEKALRKYFALASIPLVVLASVVITLFSGAVDLTTILVTNENTDIFTIMLTRLPYVTVSAMLITACYQLIKYFVGQMVIINKQRMNLNKISIIANDVSIASYVGLDMSTSERYHARIQLKMELLKEHLKEEISSNYHYDQTFSVVQDEETISDDNST